MTNTFKAMNWISVKDRLPDLWEQAITWNGKYVGVLYFTPDGSWSDYEESTVDNVTHWMPLPEPPKEEAK